MPVLNVIDRRVCMEGGVFVNGSFLILLIFLLGLFLGARDVTAGILPSPASAPKGAERFQLAGGSHH